MDAEDLTQAMAQSPAPRLRADRLELAALPDLLLAPWEAAR